MEKLIDEYRRRWLEAFDKEWNQVNVLPTGTGAKDAYGCGWVIESKAWNGGPRFWRNGHGWMGTLRQATIFVKKNDAISKCVKLGSQNCTVMEASFSTGRIVYPPSRAE